MSGALDALPRLRADLTIVRREHRGRVDYVVKQPEAGKYYRFGEPQVALMRLMDGRRTPAEIAERAGMGVSAGQLADFVHKLKRLGLVERTPAEQHLMMIEHLRAERRGRVRRASILRLRVPIGDPDRLFTAMVRRLGWLWSPGFVACSVVLFGTYVAIIALRWDEFVQRMLGLYTLREFGIRYWLLSYGVFLVIGGIHELGHGLTTKRFGGEVHQIGAMLLYFSPALFCDTSDAWTFERRAHRLWVSFAGPWIQLFLGALAAVVWALSEPATALHRVSFIAMLVGGISSVLANLNPLVPLDGYYALADWLEIPNLRRRSFAWWSWRLKHRLLGLGAPEPDATPRERRVFATYGALASVYSGLTVMIAILWMVLVLGRIVGPWVWLPVSVILVRVGMRAWGRVGTLAGVAGRAALSRRRKVATAFATAVCAVVLPFVLPWTPRARGEFRVEAAPRARLHAEVEGVLDRLEVTEGDGVPAGAVLATLWNAQLQAHLLEARKRADLLRIARGRAEAAGDRAAAASAGAELEQVGEQLTVLERERERLTIRAPLDGVVLAYRLRERLGEKLSRGEPLLELAAAQGRIARVRVPLERSAGIAAGQRVTLKLSARPDLKFVSRVAAVGPAAREGWLEVEVPLPRDAWEPSPGMTGVAKIVTGKGTVAGALVRLFRRNVRLDLLL